MDLSAWLLHAPRSLYLALAGLYMGVIYFLSSLKLDLGESEYPKIWSFLGNLFHCPLYAGLAATLLLGFRRPGPERDHLPPRAALTALAVLIAYGIFDELHQSWSGRNPSVLDVITDLMGGLLAWLVIKRILDGVPSTGYFLLLGTLLAIGASLSAGFAF